MMTTVTVHLHTILQRQTAGGPQRLVVIELPESTTMADLLTILEIELRPESLLLAVNGRIASLERVLIDGDEVRIMPAMSGGLDQVQLTHMKAFC
jgi:sulfur carrier protein ThiS